MLRCKICKKIYTEVEFWVPQIHVCSGEHHGLFYDRILMIDSINLDSYKLVSPQQNYDILDNRGLIYGIDVGGHRSEIVSAFQKRKSAKAINAKATSHGFLDGSNKHYFPTADSINNYWDKKNSDPSFFQKNLSNTQIHPDYVDIVEEHSNRRKLYGINSTDWPKLCKMILEISATIKKPIQIHFDLSDMNLNNAPNKVLWKGNKSITDQEYRYAFRLSKVYPNFRPKGWFDGLEVGMPWERDELDKQLLFNRTRIDKSRMQMSSWDKLYEDWKSYKPKMNGMKIVQLLNGGPINHESIQILRNRFDLLKSSTDNYVGQGLQYLGRLKNIKKKSETDQWARDWEEFTLVNGSATFRCMATNQFTNIMHAISRENSDIEVIKSLTDQAIKLNSETGKLLSELKNPTALCDQHRQSLTTQNLPKYKKAVVKNYYLSEENYNNLFVNSKPLLKSINISRIPPSNAVYLTYDPLKSNFVATKSGDMSKLIFYATDKDEPKKYFKCAVDKKLIKTEMHEIEAKSKPQQF